ncbi:MAG: nucleotide exchange factor GrpE, partial [Candidatus Roizmanbacteria bacterium]|nr:nucleotide exchange factor GrpE [Candidatus Roizmanbacteria bacterium]
MDQTKIKKPVIDKSTQEIDDLKRQVEEFKNKYLRALADYQNLEKRVSEERFELMKMADKNLLVKILP